MAHTLAKVGRPFAMGNKICQIATVNVTSYTSGGEVINVADIGFSQVDAVFISAVQDMTTRNYTIESEEDGTLTSSSTFSIVSVDMDGTNAQTSAATDIGMVRLMIMGSR